MPHSHHGFKIEVQKNISSTHKFLLSLVLCIIISLVSEVCLALDNKITFFNLLRFIHLLKSTQIYALLVLSILKHNFQTSFKFLSFERVLDGVHNLGLLHSFLVRVLPTLVPLAVRLSSGKSLSLHDFILILVVCRSFLPSLIEFWLLQVKNPLQALFKFI